MPATCGIQGIDHLGCTLYTTPATWELWPDRQQKLERSLKRRAGQCILCPWRRGFCATSCLLQLRCACIADDLSAIDEGHASGASGGQQISATACSTTTVLHKPFIASGIGCPCISVTLTSVYIHSSELQLRSRLNCAEDISLRTTQKSTH